MSEKNTTVGDQEVGDWATGGTLAAHEIGCLVETGYLVEIRMLGSDKPDAW